MKKLLILSITIGLFITGAYAADTLKKDDDGAAVSYAVQNQFRADFRNVKEVVWTVTSTCQKAEFVQDNVKKTAFYNLSGEFLGTTQKSNYKQIPAKAQKEIAESYKGYTVADVIELQTGDSLEQFVDLKNGEREILVRVAPSSGVYFFQQVK